jgi:glutamate N-acetyltransferase/amino-acid N-acetyltransferase
MGQEAMSSEEIDIQISLSMGNQEAKIWTTDLSYDYVKINAEYRT